MPFFAALMAHYAIFHTLFISPDYAMLALRRLPLLAAATKMLMSLYAALMP